MYLDTVAPVDTTAATIHLAGDSTMAVQLASRKPGAGWGESLSTLVCKNVRVLNHAKNGQSTKSFISGKHWKNVLDSLRSGDVVLIQFGHNDQKSASPELYAEARSEYRENLQRFVSDVRKAESEPVLLSSIVRRKFNSENNLQQTLGEYPQVTREVSNDMDTALIDLNSMTSELVESLGPGASKSLYLHLAPGEHKNYRDGMLDDTHLSTTGANEVATLVAEELKKLQSDLICN